jgi:hypothetical protein
MVSVLKFTGQGVKVDEAKYLEKQKLTWHCVNTFYDYLNLQGIIPDCRGYKTPP